MRRIVLEAPGRLGVEEVDRPQPGASEAEIRIGKVGICGSDIHLYRSGALGPSRVEGPFVIGHECMGEVVAVPRSADPDLVGSRVSIEPALHCGRCP
jgi:L-iditol 2-dehydrogenase